MKTVCIDIDGTITDPYFFISYLNKLTGKQISEYEFTSENWNEVYGYEFEYIFSKFDKNYGYIYSEAELVDNVKSTIGNMDNLGLDIVFVTARSEYVEDITNTWMKRVGLDKFRVVFLGSNSKKLEEAKKIGADIFIEDNSDNAIILAENGIKVILINANYNRNIFHENISRVYNWDEINFLMESLCQM